MRRHKAPLELISLTKKSEYLCLITPVKPVADVQNAEMPTSLSDAMEKQEWVQLSSGDFPRLET